jgi:Ca2+-binding EF-hand superfamily protein
MRTLAVGLFLAGLFAVAASGEAQPPGGGKEKKGEGKGGPGGKGGKAATVEEMVARLMAYDKNGDGKLTKEELADARLHPLFERADANNDGVVTKEELTALLTKEAAALAGGAGGPGGFGPPPIGQLFPAFAQEQLKLTDTQKKELDAIQKDVDAKVEKLLTDDQKKAYKELKERGPGRFPPKD